MIIHLLIFVVSLLVRNGIIPVFPVLLSQIRKEENTLSARTAIFQ